MKMNPILLSILVLLLFSVAPAEEGSLLGAVESSDPAVGSGAGCYLYSSNKAGETLLNASASKASAFINIRGKNTKIPPNFELYPEEQQELKVGDQWKKEVQVKGLLLIMKLSLASKCEPGSECAGDTLEGQIQVYRAGKLLETHPVSGGCGC